MASGTKQKIISLEALVPDIYDEQTFEYTGDNLTKINYLFRGEIIAEVTMEYTGDKLTRRYRSGP